MTLPLTGIRVLDFTHFVAGPWSTSLLADFGAEVIKIEHPRGGDGSRQLDRVFGADMSSYFVGLNRGKRSLTLDLSTSQGKEVIGRLLETTDVLIANFRPGVLERLGFGYDDLAQQHPRLLHVNITAFGPHGPLAQRPAMDIIVQAAGGIMGLTGEPEGMPLKVGAPIGDFVGAYLAFSAISMGLLVREKQGFGQRIDISLLDGQVSMLANFMTGHAINGAPQGPQGGAHPQIVPYQVFATADGNIVVGCLTQSFWLALCEVLERADLAADPRFASNADRVVHRHALITILENTFRARGNLAWLEALAAKGVPCGEVSSLTEVASSEQVRANGMIVETDHPHLGPVRLLGNPIHLNRTPPRVAGPAPLLGEHSAEILRELGYSETEIEQLSACAN